MNLDPMFNSTSFGNTGKDAFLLQKNSLLRKDKFLLPDYFAITNYVTDVGGNTLPTDKKLFPGAYIK
jgi:hypothetical protein